LVVVEGTLVASHRMAQSCALVYSVGPRPMTMRMTPTGAAEPWRQKVVLASVAPMQCCAVSTLLGAMSAPEHRPPELTMPIALYGYPRAVTKRRSSVGPNTAACPAWPTSLSSPPP
jgi:hypothetical protein